MGKRGQGATPQAWEHQTGVFLVLRKTGVLRKVSGLRETFMLQEEGISKRLGEDGPPGSI